MMSTLVASLFLLLGSAAAAPQPITVADGLVQRDSLVYRAENPNVARTLEQVTITLVNSMSKALSTSIASNAGATLVSGDGGPTTMAPQATATFVAPVGWSGNVALGEADYSMTGNDYTGLLEFGLTLQGDETKFDVDASYV